MATFRSARGRELTSPKQCLALHSPTWNLPAAHISLPALAVVGKSLRSAAEAISTELVAEKPPRKLPITLAERLLNVLQKMRT